VMASPEQYRKGNTEWEELICFSFLLACNDVYDLIRDRDSYTVPLYVYVCICIYVYVYIFLTYILHSLLLFLFTKYVL